MDWTYTNDPEHVPRDKLRELVGDTNSLDKQLSDQTIAELLGKYGTTGNALYEAAIEACETLAAKYARDQIEWTGDETNSPALKVDNYLKLAREYRKQLSEKGKEGKARKPGFNRTTFGKSAQFSRSSKYPGYGSG
ncbi:Uncharacterised protein [uncultured archaeon]|nr:Uncharacterised protein [uncultured archaeon]